MRRVNKRDKECTTCWRYARCNLKDRAVGMPCCDYGRKEKKSGRKNEQSKMDKGRTSDR